MSSAEPLPTPSALTTLLHTYTTDFPSPYSHPLYLHHLALQILHNLEHQQLWTELKLHTHSPLAPHALLPRPLISGLPSRRLYVHPDEQIEIVKREVERQRKSKRKTVHGADKDEKSGSTVAAEGEDGVEAEEDLQPEREWVLPTHLRERWSLRQMAGVFDGICLVPPPTESPHETEDGTGGGGGGGQATNKWRQTKRVLLAMLEDDSTVLYYIVHDGIVKPRQN